jgi:hypothetical protein
VTFPAKESPEDEPSFTGWEGNPKVPSPARAPATAPQEPTPEPAGPPPAADKSSGPTMDSTQPGAADADLPGEQMADVELAHEGAAADPPGVTYAPPPAEAGSPARATSHGVAVDAVSDSRWSKIQAIFVDDPRSAVAEAAALADDAVEAFIATVREQQASLASSWQAEGANTEQLRAAFREYRTFWNSMTGLSQPA